MPQKEMPIGPAARFFEDFSEGDEFVTQGRTLTETDLMSWAMFTGDMNSMHVDEDFASEYGLFGGRFPPGLMAVAIASGLWERLPGSRSGVKQLESPCQEAFARACLFTRRASIA